MSYESLISRYPDFKCLFSSLYTQIEEQGYNPMDLLPDSIKYLSRMIKDQNDLREAVDRVRRYLCYKDETEIYDKERNE